MAKSYDLGPGAYVWLKGATTHVTSDVANPSCAATAYATASSNPFPVYGSSSFQDGWSFVSPPEKNGGQAGLSVPIVSMPGATTCRLSLAHAFELGLAVALGLARDGLPPDWADLA